MFSLMSCVCAGIYWLGGRPLRPVGEKIMKKVFPAFLLLFKNYYSLNFALHAIITSSQQSLNFCDCSAIILLIFRQDPKTHCSGSAPTSSPPGGHITHPVGAIPPPVTLYAVFFPPVVIRRAGAENGGMFILCACYTSGNHEITENSDQQENGIR